MRARARVTNPLRLRRGSERFKRLRQFLTTTWIDLARCGRTTWRTSSRRFAGLWPTSTMLPWTQSFPGWWQDPSESSSQQRIININYFDAMSTFSRSSRLDCHFLTKMEICPRACAAGSSILNLTYQKTCKSHRCCFLFYP